MSEIRFDTVSYSWLAWDTENDQPFNPQPVIDATASNDIYYDSRVPFGEVYDATQTDTIHVTADFSESLTLTIAAADVFVAFERDMRVVSVATEVENGNDVLVVNLQNGAIIRLVQTAAGAVTFRIGSNPDDRHGYDGTSYTLADFASTYQAGFGLDSAIFDPIAGPASILVGANGQLKPVLLGPPVSASDPNGDPIVYSLDSVSLALGFDIDAQTGQVSYHGDGSILTSGESLTVTIIASSHSADGDNTQVQQALTVNVVAGLQTANEIRWHNGGWTVWDVVNDQPVANQPDERWAVNNLIVITADVTDALLTGGGGDDIFLIDDTLTNDLEITKYSTDDSAERSVVRFGSPAHVTSLELVEISGLFGTQTDLLVTFDGGAQLVVTKADDFYYQIINDDTRYELADFVAKFGAGFWPDRAVFEAIGQYIIFEDSDGTLEPVLIGEPFQAIDEDGDVVTYSLSPNAADGFVIDSATGQLSYTGSNAELRALDSIQSITVRASSLGADGRTVETISHTIALTIAEVSDPPIITNLGVVDGQLSFTGPPESFNQEPDTTYSITVIATSIGATGSTAAVQTTVPVLLLRQMADAVFDPLVGDYSLFFEADGQTTPVNIGNPITATDINGDAVSYSLDVTSANAGFNIDATTGQLSYTGAPDSFTQDPGTSFSVTVLATSIGATGQSVSVPLIVPVVLLHEPADPIFDVVSGDYILFFEADGQTSAVTIGNPITASDLNEDAIEYAIDAASAALGFDIDAATGQLLYTGAPNSFTQDPGTSLTITVSATALGASGQPVTIQTSVSVVLEHAPADAVFDPIIGDYILFFEADGQTTPVNIGAPITATDINGDPVSYSVSNTSAVNGFAIDAVTGQLSYIGAPESFSQPAGSSYSVTVIARSIGVSGQETNVVRTVNVVLSNETPGTSGSDIVNQGSTAGDFIIETGDGNDEITVGRGDNDIDAGPGDDIIDIRSGGRDRLAMRVSFDGAALDGDDVVAGFEAGEDIVEFVKITGDTYNGPGTEPATTAEWLARMAGDDGVPLSPDDLMIVSPIITFADDGTPIVSGLRFQFSEGSLHNGGAAISLGRIEVNFATPLTIDEFLAAIGGAENYDINLMAIIDLTTGLRGLLGRDGIRYGADVVVKTSLSHADVVAALANDEDLWNWDVSALVSGDSLFYDPTGTNQDILDFNQDIGNWDVGNMLFTFSMFRGAASFNQDIGDWDVGRVTNFQSMFQDATSFNQDISGWDISSATTLADMFSGASAFNQNLGSWDISSLATAAGIFDDPDGNSVLSTANLDATLRGWARLDTAAGETAIQNNVVFGASGQSYTAATTIAYLEATYSWTFEAGMVFDISAAWQGTSAGDAYNANVASTVRSFHGLGGNDIITGTTNDEHFYGGAGNDTLIGGGGSDTFHYLHTNSGSDTIIGFDSANDKIDLSLLLVGYDPATSHRPDFVQTSGINGNADTQIIIDHDGGNSPDFDIILQGVTYTGINQIDDFLAADALVLV